MQNEKLKIAIKNSKLDIKERSYHFALKIIKLVESLPNDRVCKIIADQLLRSATSIGANIIEAQAASSKRDFTNFLNYSLKSANETKFWLGLLRDSGKKDRRIINPLLDETKQLSSILASSILKLKRKKL
ncbi:MAG: four helix bundle protein [Deltaproteobacteria bacterium]|nr:four helix bundle protein [Deltaproteobacteria bacterium]